MKNPSAEELTGLLKAWSDGDDGAMETLIPLVYQDLRRIARRHMRGERGDHTLQTTALVHEAFLRLSESSVSFTDRGHFYAVAARLMRHVLVDLARSRQTLKRGGDVPALSLDEAFHGACNWGELLAVDDALEALANFDPRRAKVVELRFFGGFSVDETARALEVSPDTVMRDWKLAKAWLVRELSPS